jgi:cardiolipin synthase (CMP-forming)
MRALVIIPNALSALRLGLALWFPFAPGVSRPFLLVAAALSDFIDGYMARRYHLATWIGGLLDAVADKLFALSVLLTFTLGRELHGWQALLLLARDFAVGLIALYAIVRGKWYAFRHMPARPLGKITTAGMFLLFLLLAVAPDRARLVWPAFIVAALLSVAAASDYLAVFVHARRLDRQRPYSGTARPSAAREG